MNTFLFKMEQPHQVSRIPNCGYSRTTPTSMIQPNSPHCVDVGRNAAPIRIKLRDGRMGIVGYRRPVEQYQPEIRMDSLIEVTTKVVCNSIFEEVIRQRYFEAIVIAIGDNKTVMEVAQMMNLDIPMLLDLVNKTRSRLGFRRINERMMQFDMYHNNNQHEVRVEKLSRDYTNIPVRTVRLAHIPRPSVSGPPPNTNNMMSVNRVDNDVDMPSQDTYQEPYSLDTEINRIERDSCREESSNRMNGKNERVNFDDGPSRTTVEGLIRLVRMNVLTDQRKARRTKFDGTSKDLREYFKKLMLIHHQEPNIAFISALCTVVIKRKWIDYAAAEVNCSSELVSLFLRLALFDVELEHAKVKVLEDVKPSQDELHENKYGSDPLEELVNEISIPTTVNSIKIVFDLIEKNSTNASKKAFTRFVLYHNIKDPMKRFAMVQSLDSWGSTRRNKIYDEQSEYISYQLEKFYTCISMGYDKFIESSRQCIAELNEIKSNEGNTRPRRESGRIKARESLVSDRCHIQNVMSPLMVPFIVFIRKLMSVKFRLDIDMIICIAEKAYSLSSNDNKRMISNQSWNEWINHILIQDYPTVFDYINHI